MMVDRAGGPYDSAHAKGQPLNEPPLPMNLLARLDVRDVNCLRFFVVSASDFDLLFGKPGRLLLIV
jgi:hypothetical protein